MPKQSIQEFEFIFSATHREKILRHATTGKHFRDLRAAFTTVHDGAPASADKCGADKKQFQITRQWKSKGSMKNIRVMNV